jgi:outer membrane protein OmpA-like peptidoglycan-associated protein
MANVSYGKPLLAVGVLGLVVTCIAATSLETSPAANATPSAAVAVAKSAPSQQTAAVVASQAAAPAPAPALVVNSEVANAGREAACQAEFDSVVKANPIDFLRDRNDLSPKGKAAVAELLVVARACSGMKIEIQGYTDSTGRRSNNIRLSRKRADAVKNYLVELGLSPDLLTAVGFGPDHPVASNRTSSGRAQNRRIEFRVSRRESE